MYTLEGKADESLDQPEEQLRSLARQATEAMAAEGHDPNYLSRGYALDMRYRGQSHELTVPYQPGVGSVAVCESFHAAHESRYGYRRPEAAIEIVTCRLTATATVTLPVVPEQAPGPADAAAAALGEKAVWFGERFTSTQTYDRERLRPGHRITGPALVFQYDTTTLIPPGWSAVVDRWSNLVLSAG
jgi:N-methylhydantoinase A